jgi:CheY-like chemotaxis protein
MSAARPKLAPMPRPKAARGVLASSPMLAVVIDDNAAVRELFALFLRDAGFTVVTAPDSREALELCRGATLVLTDIATAEGSGIELVRKLRKRDQRVVIVTMSATPLHLSNAVAVGADAALPKPFSLDDLAAVITSARSQQLVEAAP